MNWGALKAQFDLVDRDPSPRNITRLREAVGVAVARSVDPSMLETPPVWFSEVVSDVNDRAQRIAQVPGLDPNLNIAVMMFSSLRITDGGRRTPTWLAPSEGLTHQLLATDLKGLVVADLKLPLDAFYIELPPGVFYTKDRDTGWHEVRVLVVSVGAITQQHLDQQHEQGDPTAIATELGKRLVIEAYGMPNAQSKNLTDDAWVFQSYCIEDELMSLEELSAPVPFTGLSDEVRRLAQRVMDSIEGRLGLNGELIRGPAFRVLLIRFVMNLCVYLSTERATKKLRNEEAISKLLDGKKRKNLRASILDKVKRLESDRVFDIGTDVQVDEDIKRYVLTGKGTGTTLSYRVIVRGHWRNQAHGPGRALRKQRWIAPHVRGAELDTKIVGHNYKIGDT